MLCCADDAAPKASKSRWLALFYLCIPVGYAAGYILGGLIAPALGWRAAFFLEAAAMLPFALFCAFGPSLDLKGKALHTGAGPSCANACLPSCCSLSSSMHWAPSDVKGKSSHTTAGSRCANARLQQAARLCSALACRILNVMDKSFHSCTDCCATAGSLQVHGCQHRVCAF